MPWTQSEAVALCRKIEEICPQYGCHVALTGGTLYKDGERKDCDILFYRIRQVEEINFGGLLDGLRDIGINYASGFGWCVKFDCDGKNIDAFFPEEQGEYPVDEDGDIETNSLIREWKGDEADERWLRKQLREMGQNYNGEPA